jgi:hypothetical protein
MFNTSIVNVFTAISLCPTPLKNTSPGHTQQAHAFTPTPGATLQMFMTNTRMPSMSTPACISLHSALIRNRSSIPTLTPPPFPSLSLSYVAQSAPDMLIMFAAGNQGNLPFASA